MRSIIEQCGHCHGTNFPEGMFVCYCPACRVYIHPGCWDAHVRARHSETSDKVTPLKPRRGKISAYGIIQWDNEGEE